MNRLGLNEEEAKVNSSKENLKHTKWECKYHVAIARRFMDRTKNFVGLNFWARGYYVSTVGRDEAQVRQYIREQENEDRWLDQLKMFE